VATDWDALEAGIHAWVVGGSGLTADQVIYTQQPGSPRPPEPAIMMKFYVIDEIGRSWVDTVDNPLVFADKTVTAVTGNNLTITAHGLLNGDGPVRIASTGTVPPPLLAATDYWVIVVDANTIRLASTFNNTGGDYAGNTRTPITLSGAGTGTITISDTADSLRAGEEISHVARGMSRLGLSLYCHTSTGVSMGSAMAILRRVAERARLPSQQQILDDLNVGLNSIERTRPLLGTKDAVMFEPRAWVDIHLTVPYEESEVGRIIRRTLITNLGTGQVTSIPEP
jgi:hypothetical protein